MNDPGIQIVLLAVSALAVSCSSGDRSSDSFDTPIRIVRVDVGPSPYVLDPNIRATLDCYYYPQIMIKQHNGGGFGADRISMVAGPQEFPECELERSARETVVDLADWEGWFKGVKDSLVFFDAPDVFNGHSPFAVFDSRSGKKIFEDTAYAEAERSGSRTSHVRVVPTDQGYLLRYMRVADTDCNLNLEPRSCWRQIKARLALPIDDAPVCAGYDHIAELVGTDDVESVIAYPVEVVLSALPVINAVAGTAKCWPAQ